MDKQTNYNEFESVYKMSSSDALSELRTYINNPDFSPELEDLLFAETDNVIKKFYGKVRSADLNGYTTNKVYKFSNENLYKLMNKLNSQFKKVLTVGSSGDQAIAAIANGAEEVVIADLNMYTKMFTELKIAAIKNLNHAEFKSYFEFDLMKEVKKQKSYMASSLKKMLNDYKVYQKISHSLPDDVKLFWDSLMLEDFSKAEVEMFHYGGFSDFGSIFSAKAKYNKVQSKLKNNKYKISYEVADFGEFAERIKEKFDLILLSNVGDYYIDSHSGLEFRKIVSNLYHEKLNENGVMQVSSSVSKGLSVFDAMYANGGLYEEIDVENGFLKEYTGLHGQVGSLLLKKQAVQNLEQKEREF